MAWFWKSRKEWQDELEVKRACMDVLRAEIVGMKQQISEMRSAAEVRERQLEDAKEAHLKVEALLTQERDYWRRVSEVFIDKQAIRDTGLPIFHLPPEIQQPEPEAQPEESGHPRGHILRNPRAHVQHATIEKTIEFNNLQVRSSTDSMKAALAAIDREATRRAAVIPAVPSAPTTATMATESAG